MSFGQVYDFKMMFWGLRALCDANIMPNFSGHDINQPSTTPGTPSEISFLYVNYFIFVCHLCSNRSLFHVLSYLTL